MMIRNEYVVMALASMLSAASAFRNQSVGVVGRLTCGGSPLPNTEVKLWDKVFLGKDVLLATGQSDAAGRFNISGGSQSLTKMNVHFKVYHTCQSNFGVGWPIKRTCRRKVDLEVPATYITRTSTVERWFDAGVLNMAFLYPRESTECS